MSDPGTTSDRQEALAHLTDALRDVIERFVATSAPLEVFGSLADDLRRVAERLDEYPQSELYFGYAEAANAGGAEGPFDNSPLMGRCNPLAPPLRLEMLEDRVEGTVVFGSAYEGPPGHVHGGYVAAVFDEVLGMTQSLSGAPGMTGRLTIHYRKPTPLHTELRLVGTIEHRAGRKTLCRGELYAGEQLTAEAEGLFISIDFGRFAELRDQREATRLEARSR